MVPPQALARLGRWFDRSRSCREQHALAEWVGRAQAVEIDAASITIVSTSTTSRHVVERKEWQLAAALFCPFLKVAYVQLVAT